MKKILLALWLFSMVQINGCFVFTVYSIREITRFANAS